MTAGQIDRVKLRALLTGILLIQAFCLIVVGLAGLGFDVPSAVWGLLLFIGGIQVFAFGIFEPTYEAMRRRAYRRLEHLEAGTASSPRSRRSP